MYTAAELRTFARQVDKTQLEDEERRGLYEAARSLSLALESPFDAMHRLLWSVAQLPMVKVGIDLGLFRTLAEEAEKKWTVDELAVVVKADRTLLYRVLRYFFSFGIVRENSDFTYSANATCQWLATPGAESGVVHYMRNIAPVLTALPAVLAHQSHRNPTDPTDTAFQVAHNTTSHAYSWIPPDPAVITAFLTFMQSQRATQKPWTAAFPLHVLRLSDSDLSAGRALFVDVGGAMGHQCVFLRRSQPLLAGRVVLQDQPLVVERMAAVTRAELDELQIEVLAYDFFTPQPVRGAKAYYLRNIMHDWPDEKCVEILTVLKGAMVGDSMILIDDMVLPDQGASWKQAQKDIQMMAVVASMERSETQWKMLVENAGLKILNTCTYDTELGDSVIIVGKA